MAFWLGFSTRGDNHLVTAARQFQRSFVLAEGIEVTAARLEDGLLHIELFRPMPEPQVKSIKIQKGGASGKPASRTIDVDTEKK